MIDGLAVWIGPEAVVVTAATPLSVLSSAVWGGGLVSARAIVNLHVALDDPCTNPPRMFAAYARAQSVPEPYVGLLTGAWTERATVGEESGAGIRTLAVTTVGLSNRVAAGRAPVTQWTHGTINTIVVVDADPEPAALGRGGHAGVVLVALGDQVPPHARRLADVFGDVPNGVCRPGA